ncbi:MAG: DUF5615 family PIN-like protein [Chloroflexota bacterium]|nr:MAG: hypothetical protein DLM70_13235 [Chloroflexota bacterium]
MAELYLDNDVSLRLAPLLRAAGHRVITTRELELADATDDAQLLTAAQQHWILITSNRGDFRLFHDAWRTGQQLLGWCSRRTLACFLSLRTSRYSRGTE